MTEYVFVPIDTGEPSREELRLLIKHLGHDVRGSFQYMISLAGYIPQLEKCKRTPQELSDRIIDYAIHAGNIVTGVANLDASTLNFNLEETLEDLGKTFSGILDYPKTKVVTNTIGKIPCQNNEELMYILLFNITLNAVQISSENVTKGQDLRSEEHDEEYYALEDKLINVEAKTRKLTEEELVYLGPNQAQYTPEDDFVQIQVKDSSIGIPKEDLPYIFEGKSRKSDKGGVGLRITNYVCNKTHGFIKVKSEVGKGSTFSLYFPRQQKKRPLPKQLKLPF
jgi:signal transduction histidine kinase